MQNKVYYSLMSRQDLDEIWDYIALELYNPDAAAYTVTGIMDRVNQLADFSETGSKLFFDNGLDSGYRYVVLKNYMAFYHIGGSAIYVDRVIYAKRDYMRMLFPEK